MYLVCVALYFFFKDTANTEIYTYVHPLSLPYALPIFGALGHGVLDVGGDGVELVLGDQRADVGGPLVAGAEDQCLGASHEPLDEPVVDLVGDQHRSEEHTSELQSLMRISYAVFCLKKKQHKTLLYQTKQRKQ